MATGGGCWGQRLPVSKHRHGLRLVLYEIIEKLMCEPTSMWAFLLWEGAVASEGEPSSAFGGLNVLPREVVSVVKRRSLDQREGAGTTLQAQGVTCAKLRQESTAHTQGDANRPSDADSPGQGRVRQPGSGWTESGSLLKISHLVSQFNSLAYKLCICAFLYIPFIS